MLKGIDPLLTPELLMRLAEMGHGDEIVIADANFTAARLATRCPVVHLPGVDVERAAQAVLGLLPLESAGHMQVEGRAGGWRSAQQQRVVAMIDRGGHLPATQVQAVERFAFYDRARAAHVIVLTGELQPYANFIFAKGVIGAPLEA
jgi:L-fucose mutarotase